MKYCLSFNKKKETYLNKADEIKISYNRRDSSLIDFLLKYKEKRIILTINEISDFIYYKNIERFISIKEMYPYLDFTLEFPQNFLDQLDEEEEKNLLTIIKENNIKFCFFTLVSDWDVFKGLINLGVSDIYIVDNMAFELDKCSKIAHENNIYIRVFPNIAQSKWDNTPGEKKFFIRPEDLQYYDDFVDVVEFLGDNDNFYTIFDIYYSDKQWHGNLNEIIYGLDTDLDSRFIIPEVFAKTRIKCGKKCMKGIPCNICTKIKDVSETLKNKNLIIK